jgi:hypothetical protein
MSALPDPAPRPLVLLCLLGLGLCGCPSPDGVRIHRIQGTGHESPLAGQDVRGVRGVVTAVDAGERRPGFWIQDPEGDGDDATSEGIFVTTAEAPAVAPGQRLEVDGRVEEHADPERPADLTLTSLAARDVRVLSSGELLPPPVRIGRRGRTPPRSIDDDGLAVFEPASDAIDFYESLEGMRVEVDEAVVAGATTRFGEIAVLADGGAGVEPRTPRGGVLLREDGNPERLLVASRLSGRAPRLDVGARLAAPLTGVLDYSFGNFKVLPPEPWPPARPAEVWDEATALVPGEGRLTLATFNVYNLSARDPEEKLVRLAATLVRDLGAPDVVGLQEIQDENGAEDDAVVDATATLEALVAAVETAGGPRYAFRQIDPEDDADGGQPGGNIRVALLFDPSRVAFVDRGQGGALDATAVEKDSGGVRLSLSPGRLAPRNAAFAGSRKPLAAELAFRGRTFFVIVTHLNSKSGDDRLMGSRQPPRRPSEERRMAQARAVRELMDDFLELDPEARVVVLGDMNELVGRPPMRALAAPPWVDLIERVPAAERYTYVFEGSSQVLDHVVVSPALAERADPEIDVVHVNADRADGNRASDHDPVVVRLTFE